MHRAEGVGPKSMSRDPGLHRPLGAAGDALDGDESSLEVGIKECPVCHARCFADMDTCYGCLHSFLDDAPCVGKEPARKGERSEVDRGASEPPGENSRFAAPNVGGDSEARTRARLVDAVACLDEGRGAALLQAADDTTSERSVRALGGDGRTMRGEAEGHPPRAVIATRRVPLEDKTFEIVVSVSVVEAT